MAKRTKNDARKFKHNRIRYNIRGTANIPRLNVFKSNTGIYAQLIDDEKGVTLAQASTQLLKLKGNTVENAKKVGSELGKKAKTVKIEKVVFDRGGYIYHGKIKALADAARAEGLKF